MHTVLYVLHCFCGMNNKKIYRIKENYILHFTNSECVLFSTAECLTYVCSLFMGVPMKPYFWPDYRN